MYLLIFLIFFGAGIGCLCVGVLAVFRFTPIARRYLMRLLAVIRQKLPQRVSPRAQIKPVFRRAEPDWDRICNIPTIDRQGELIYQS